MPLFAQTEIIGDISVWREYGLPGLVIFAMFAAFFLFGRSVLKRNEEDSKERSAFLEKVMEGHAEERAAWRQDLIADRQKHAEAMEKLTDRTVAAIADNTQSVQSLGHELRQIIPRAR